MLKRTLYCLIVLLVFTLSFSFYSSMFYPLLGSDDTLNILMAHYYKLPQDFYCWGQDRGGTLIPLLSQFFIKIFHFSALTSVSLSNYLILAIGYFSFASLFKTYYGKILFLIVWFLPFQRFVEILRYPIGVEYSLIGLAIFLSIQYEKNNELSKFRKNLKLLIVVLIFIISVWVSDLAMISIGVLLFVVAAFNFMKSKKVVFEKLVLFYLVFGSVSCFLFIRYLKTFAVTKTENYLFINNFHQVKAAILLLVKSFYEVLAFKTNEVLISIYTYSVIIFLISLAIYVLKKKRIMIILSNKWVLFFIIDFFVIFTTILFSTWVLANGMGRWYFVCSYISLSIAIILAVEQLQNFKCKVKIFKIFLFIIAIIGAISPIYSMKYISPKTLKPRAVFVHEFEKLGNIGVIGEYWNSYINSCTNPDMIKAVPHDQTWPVRNKEIIEDVFKRENIYLIKDMWLDTFPDTIIQYGRVLIKNGNEFNIGNSDVCKYKKN